MRLTGLASAGCAVFLVACSGTNQPDIRPVDRVTGGINAADVDLDGDPFWSSDGERLRHEPSGVACPLTLEGFVFIDRQSFPGLPNGADVACRYESGPVNRLTLHLTNFGQPVTSDTHMRSVEQSIFSVRAPSGPTKPPLDPGGYPIALQHAAYELPAGDGKPERQTAIWIETMGDWHMKVRATYTADAAELVGTAVFRLYTDARRATQSGAT